MREDDRQLTLALEGPRAGDTLEEHAAEGIDIRTPVDPTTRDLLGRDVVDRSDEAPVAGEAAHRRDVAGESEVADVQVLRFVQPRHEQVAGLHVAVDEPRLVRGVERLGCLADEVDGTRGVERPLLPQHLAQVRALDVFHHQVEPARVLTGSERRNDVRVIETRRQLGFAQEALPEALVLGDLVAEQLQRRPTTVPRVLGEEHRAHGALADKRSDAEAGDDVAGTRR